MSEPLPDYVDWQDLPSRATPVSAANLRRDQDATKARLAVVDEVVTRVPESPTGAAGTYEPTRVLYNYKPAQLARYRAALAGAYGSGECRIACFGTSIAVGQGVTDRNRDSYHGALRRLLAGRGVPVAGTGPVIANPGDSPLDSRWVTSLTWTKFNPGPTYRTALYQSPSASSTATYTSANTGTIVEVWYSNASASFTVAIDGGSAVTVTPAGGTSIGKYQVTGLANTTHTVVVSKTTGTVFLAAACVRAASGVSVAGAASGGARVGDTNLNQPYDIEHFMLSWAPHLVIAAFATNEANTGVSVATFTTNMQTMIDHVKAAGVDLILCAEIPANGVDLLPYRQAVYDLADLNNLPVIDLYDRWGSYTSANALGMMSDNFHPTAVGYQEYANAIYAVVGG